MQTERVTFLTTAEHKAALDAFALANGLSVGHVLREASSRYIAEQRISAEEEAAMKVLLDELEEALPRWNARFDSMEASLDRAHRSVQEALAVSAAAKAAA